MLKKILLIDSLSSYVAFSKVLFGMALLPIRFLTPFPRCPSQRLRNSLRSDILAARPGRVPSKDSSGRLNLQWSLRPSRIDPLKGSLHVHHLYQLEKILILLLIIALFTSPYLRGLEVERITTPSGFIVELTYKALQPGEIIVVNLKNDSAIKSAQVWFLNGKYFLGRNQSNTGLLAFIGLNLDLEPGLYTMKIFIEKAGAWESVEKQIQVMAREFPIRRLWVPEKYIKPPPEFRDRIKVEEEILSIIFGTETDQWLGEGQFIMPCSGELFPNFGQRRIYNNEVESLHNGVDISEVRGAPVKASNSGRVVLANNLYFSGETVIIDHGLGLFSIYCHLSKMKAKRGELIKKGQIIGNIGATGRAVGPHLHWAVSVFGKSIDPLSLLSFSFD